MRLPRHGNYILPVILTNVSKVQLQLHGCSISGRQITTIIIKARVKTNVVLNSVLGYR